MQLRHSGSHQERFKRGRTYDRDGGKKSLANVAAKTSEQEHHNLTVKETDILRLLASGYSYKMISDHVNIGIDGVRFHIKKIYDKLHVHSATEAVSKAIKDHLI